MTTTETGAQVTHAFTSTCDSLLAGCPESVGDVFGHDTAANSDCLSICGDLDTVELGHVDLDT